MGSSKPSIPIAGTRTPYRGSGDQKAREAFPDTRPTESVDRPSRDVQPPLERKGIDMGAGRSTRTF